MRGVSQISPPIRILVIAVLGLMAAWMLVLKPKEEPIAPSTPAPNAQTGQPAVSDPGKVAEAAKAAVGATNAKTQATEELSGGAAAQTGTAAKPGAEPAAGGGEAAQVSGKVKGLPKPVAKAIDDRKVLVLSFWNKESADDRAVRRELRGVDRWDGDVAVHVAPVGKVSKYARITRGADVTQSPTTLVVDRNLKVTPLVGYVDTKTVDQAVLDAFRNSGGFLKDPYLKKVNNICAGAGRASFDVPNPNNVSEVPGFVSSQRRVIGRMDGRFAGLKAPKRWAGFKRATVADHKALAVVWADFAAYLGSKPSAARVLTGVATYDPKVQAIAKRYDKRMDAEHLLSCGSNA
jgi:hypothetical protein